MLSLLQYKLTMVKSQRRRFFTNRQRLSNEQEQQLERQSQEHVDTLEIENHRQCLQLQRQKYCINTMQYFVCSMSTLYLQNAKQV